MTPATAEAAAPFNLTESTSRAVAALVASHGEQNRTAIEQGVARVASRWSAKDGDSAAFEAFCAKHFVSDTAERTRLLARLEIAHQRFQHVFL
jgi:hypothetical protein